MQPQRLIPTPLDIDDAPRQPIEVIEPTSRIRFRVLRITLFLLGSFLRNILTALWPPWKQSRFPPLQQARRLRAFMEKMGGLWVKAGQIVALRRDLFPEEFCAELSRLQDSARGFPGPHARRVIEEELKRPIEEIFSQFDEQPLAAASIGQVHVARLRRPDVEVVIKVRRPHIEESFEHDLSYLRTAVRLMIRLNVSPKFRWDDMYWEIERAIFDELDYQQEAASLRRMRKNLCKDKIYVPKVFLQYCSDRVLVMERVRGVYMSEYIRASATQPEKLQLWRQENKIKAKQVGERLLFSFYRQLFEHNLYHCDLHPGNILLMRKSRVTFIDFGSVGTSDKTMLHRLLQIFRAVGERDYNKVADYSLLLAPSLPNKDLSQAKAEIARMYRDLETASKIKSLPYQQKSMGHVAGKIAEVWSAEGIPPAWGTLRSSRAELTLDASLSVLLPTVQYSKVLRRYMRAMQARQKASSRSAKRVRGQMALFINSANLPGKIGENAYLEGEYLRKRALVYEGYLTDGARLASMLFDVLSVVFAIVALGALAGAVQQRLGDFQSVPFTFLNGPLHRLPSIEPFVWVCCIVSALLISRESRVVRGILHRMAPAPSIGGPR